MSSMTSKWRRAARTAAASFLALIAPVTACGQSVAVPQTPTQLQFQSTTLDGTPFKGGDYAGKPAVLWFWASWCPDCARESQVVAQVAAANPQVHFIGIAGKSRAPSQEEAVKQIRDFVTKYEVGGIPQVIDLKGEAFLRSNVTEIPTFVFIKPSGETTSLSGEPVEQDLANRARQTLG